MGQPSSIALTLHSVVVAITCGSRYTRRNVARKLRVARCAIDRGGCTAATLATAGLAGLCGAASCRAILLVRCGASWRVTLRRSKCRSKPARVRHAVTLAGQRSPATKKWPPRMQARRLASHLHPTCPRCYRFQLWVLHEPRCHRRATHHLLTAK